MPKRTLELLKLLGEKGFPDECFRRIHQLGSSLAAHQKYCARLGERQFAKGARGETNRDVRRRLEFIVEQADMTASQGRSVNFAQFSEEALLKYPLTTTGLSTSSDKTASQGRSVNLGQLAGEPILKDPFQVTSNELPTPIRAGGVDLENSFLDDDLLERYVNGFLGYGNLDAPFWFIGVEEGGGESRDQLTERLDVWRRRGEREVEDLADFHRAVGLEKWFAPEPPTQKTWAGYSRILLTTQGEQGISPDRIRQYQANELGSLAGESCLLELLPLPSPSISKWSYPAWSRLPYLQDRKTYFDNFAEKRAAFISMLIERHRPKVVVLCGLSKAYLRYWQMIGSPFLVYQEWPGGMQCRFGPREWHTQFAMISNGGAHGVSNAYYEGVGLLLRKRLRELTSDE